MGKKFSILYTINKCRYTTHALADISRSGIVDVPLAQTGEDDRKKGKRKRSKNYAEESTSEMGAKGAEKAQLQEPDNDMDNLSK
ncbi:hypothetical protein EZV62_000238 [Acer yangbiense]|uniref:Uncharacterized protein n=1 Tax=Acer yangbiense TaxID=1000413 RepID=A0A5C7IRF4_9ROSI|nr:hypothetical protein EZV62_000238 [Acer yangbiense]